MPIGRRQRSTSFRGREAPGATLAFLLCLLGLPAAALSQSPRGASGPAASGPREPQRYLVLLTAGATLRTTRNSDLGQERLGPAFIDGFAAYLLSGRSLLRHGPALGLSCNLSPDGGYTEPVTAGEQWVLAPSYALYLSPYRDLLLMAHAGPVFQVAGRHKSRGGEVALGAGFRVLAGTGLYAETTASLFGGAYSTLHPAVSLEVGLFLDYEALP